MVDRLRVPALATLLLAATLGHPAEDYGGEDRAAEAGRSLLGQPAPALTLERIDGGVLDLGDVLGTRPVYLKFWASWCKPCREQMPHFQSVQAAHGDDLLVLAVNIGLNESPQAIRETQEAYGLTMPVLVDSTGRAAEGFQLAVTPQHVIIDREGIVRHVGHLVTPALEQNLQTAASQAAASTPDDRPAPARGLASAGARAPEDDPPGLGLPLLDGSRFELAAHDAGPVVVTFVATWCDWYLADTRPGMAAACTAHQRRVNELARSMRDDVTWIVVAQPLWTNLDQVQKYGQRLDVAVPLGLDVDGLWFRHYRVQDVPTTLVLNGGSEQHRVPGDGAGLAAALRDTLSPAATSPPGT